MVIRCHKVQFQFHGDYSIYGNSEFRPSRLHPNEEPYPLILSILETNKPCVRISQHLEQMNELEKDDVISRCMKEIYRCTPLEYLHKYRLEQAKVLLLKSEIPISTVADRVGFNYAPYFSKCFLRYTGMTPLTFRKWGFVNNDSI